MKSLFALILLISLALYASSADARRDPGEYWRIVMKNEPMPIAIQHLMPRYDAPFEPRPTITAYHHNDTALKQEKSFKSRPTATSYRDNKVILKGEKSFEPRPSATGYHHDDVSLKQEKSSFTKDFEPRPIATSYRDDEVMSLKNKSLLNQGRL
ncbi:hypothetical protein MTR67_030393 [Solanum verrucosum]|uniref:Uncharacterized protein n=1 Tax=Solanum verrucosum TaxID=315347 RepID=A0AAF0RAF5_SOLVR|nr:hypothetical protein MTR67_030393 [Solanum verrucosum]